MDARAVFINLASMASAIGLTGCVWTRAAEIPLPAHWMPVDGKARGVIVFLPGLGDRPDYFDQHGFVDVAHAHGFDAVALDAHFGYYREGVIKERLRADVLKGLADRYDEVWLVGISLGGLGSLLYGAEWGDEVTGIIVLAPYLGDPKVWQRIEAAGGVAAWNPSTAVVGESNEARNLHQMWAWLKDTAKTGQPRLFVGIGDRDRFRRSVQLIADVLPPGSTEVQPGGHTWTVWKPIFDRLAARTFASPNHRVTKNAPTGDKPET